MIQAQIIYRKEKRIQGHAQGTSTFKQHLEKNHPGEELEKVLIGESKTLRYGWCVSGGIKLLLLNENGEIDFKFYAVTQKKTTSKYAFIWDKSKTGIFWELETTQVSKTHIF